MELSSDALAGEHYRIITRIADTRAYSAIDTTAGTECVLKVAHTADEIDALTSLSHPNVLRILDRLRVGDTECYVSPRYDMNLLEFVTKYSTIEDSVKKLAKPILEGIKHIHSKGLSHGSIRLEHIYMSITSSGPEVCIGGFGQCHFSFHSGTEDIAGFGALLQQLLAQGGVLHPSEEAADLITKCLSASANGGFSVDDALKHRWFLSSLDDSEQTME